MQMETPPQKKFIIKKKMVDLNGCKKKKMI